MFEPELHAAIFALFRLFRLTELLQLRASLQTKRASIHRPVLEHPLTPEAGLRLSWTERAPCSGRRGAHLRRERDQRK
jgi:hypothetical protein